MDTTNQQPVLSHAQPADAAPQTDLLTGSSGAPDSADAPKPLSKNALKKAAKAERFAARKVERRAREKEAKKEKKRVRAEKRAAGELDNEEDEKTRQKKKPRIQFGGRVVVDLGFDEMMNEKEISSLCSQLAYTYSANRQAVFPFSLVYTSLNGRTFNRLESLNDAGYKRWANTEWWHDSYDRLWLGQVAAAAGGQTMNTDTEPAANSSKTEDTQLQETALTNSGETAEPRSDVQQSVVYLTADSEDELTELKPSETYIIGGICDHNRYKNLCLNKAKESGIRTARLPIGRYLASLPTRKVLTVNQVFEILLKWVETKDWEQALFSVMPKRKFYSGGKDTTNGSHDGAPAEADAEDETPKEGEAKDVAVVVSVEEIEQVEQADEGR